MEEISDNIFENVEFSLIETKYNTFCILFDDESVKIKLENELKIVAKGIGIVRKEPKNIKKKTSPFVIPP